MYDFLYSEVWWMETIIAAVITAVATLIIAWLGYHGKIKEIISELASRKEEHSNLSAEHSNLSAEHSSLSAEQHRMFDRIIEKQDTIIDKENTIINGENNIKDSIIRTENNINKILEDTIRRQGKDIAVQDAIKHTTDLQNLLVSQEKHITELKSENDRLRDKISQLENNLKMMNDRNNTPKKRRFSLDDISEKGRNDDYEL